MLRLSQYNMRYIYKPKQGLNFFHRRWKRFCTWKIEIADYNLFFRAQMICYEKMYPPTWG